MKLTLKNKSIILLAALSISAASSARAQSTAFTYQGRLVDDCCPANGLYDLRFQAHSDSTQLTAVGILFVTNAVPVTNGLFSVRLDFGAVPFSAGQRRWLQVEARTNNASLPFVALLPRTELTPMPNAISALTAGTANNIVSGGVNTPALADNAVNTLKIASGAVTGSKIAAGAITADKIPAGQVVKSINGLTDAINLVAGANVTLTPSGNNLQISATGDGVFSLNGSSAYYNAGAVGIGTATPGSTLHLRNGVNSTYLTLEKTSMTYESGLRFTTGGANRWWVFCNDTSDDFQIQSGGEVDTSPRIRLPSANNNILLGLSGGNVGIGTIDPSAPLHIERTQAYQRLVSTSTANGSVLELWNTTSQPIDGPPVTLGAINFGNSFNTPGQIAYTVNQTSHSMSFRVGGVEKMQITGDGNVSVGSLTIRGGADLAEPFQMSEGEIPEGSVVVIDQQNPGRLKQATRAYDTRVAGIVSGANGVKAGIALHQEGVIEGGQNVALSGRVYVKADASHSAIKPGDLLTTSDTPGHAMKVTDSTRAQGAILGKAMTTLSEGTGMVLVLVSLQ